MINTGHKAFKVCLGDKELLVGDYFFCSLVYLNIIGDGFGKHHSKIRAEAQPMTHTEYLAYMGETYNVAEWKGLLKLLENDVVVQSRQLH
ncbi:hypothetical protein AB4254_10950 [Vibrio breoganii]